MATKITPRAQNFPQWYQDVLAAAPDLVEEAPVAGAITFGPLATKLWANIRAYVDKRLMQLGVENIMLPTLVPESFFAREKKHVKGFSPEVAVVTHAGGAKLSEPYYIRPTSELLFVDWFTRSGRVQSYRDLPLLANQWCSVMRWEKRPRTFLRTTEFHWQEGHCLFNSENQCRDFTLKILDLYAQMSEELLAIPVIKGEKPVHERFPGALNTYTIEAMMQDGKALQMGTSHVLSQDFLKNADGSAMVDFLDEKGERVIPFYDSWGVSTRLLGATIMTHGDDDGIVIPPYLAPVCATILPILTGTPEENEIIRNEARKLAAAIAGSTEKPFALHGREHQFEELVCTGRSDGSTTAVRIDQRGDVRLGDKTFHQIHSGTPVRIELGAKDLASGTCMIKSRIRSREQAIMCPLADVREVVSTVLEEDQKTLFVRARERLKKNIERPKNYDELKAALSDGKWAEVAWDGDQATVNKLKADTSGGTLRCFAFDAKEDATKEKDVVTGKVSAFARRVLVAKAY